MGGPPPQIVGGTVPPVPLGLRPRVGIRGLMRIGFVEEQFSVWSERTVER